MALNNKQQAFVEHYLTCWNASEAARQAGYSERTASEQGSRLLANVKVQEAIRERLAGLQMSADEVLARLTEQARGSLSPFLRTTPEGELVGFDLRPEQPLHLLRKATVTERTIKGMTERVVAIELLDPQTPLIKLGEARGVFRDRIADNLDVIAAAARSLEQKLMADLASAAPGDVAEQSDSVGESGS